MMNKTTLIASTFVTIGIATASGLTKDTSVAIASEATRYYEYQAATSSHNSPVLDLYKLAPNKIASNDRVWDEIELFFATPDEGVGNNNYDWLDDLRATSNNRLEEFYGSETGE